MLGISNVRTAQTEVFRRPTAGHARRGVSILNTLMLTYTRFTTLSAWCKCREGREQGGELKCILYPKSVMSANYVSLLGNVGF